MVLTTVNFDYQTRFHTNEIGNVWRDGELATELEPAQLAVAQFSPEPRFRIRLVATQLPGSCPH